MTSEGEVLVDNGASSGPRPDGRQAASIVVEGPAGGAPASGSWALVFDGQAPRWDVWISDEPSAATPAHFVDHVAEDDRLDMPSTAHNAVVVGSFVTRNQWTTVDGTAATRSAIVGNPSSFSSSGPTADDRFAPDVLAPGEYVVSALSTDASPDSPTSAFFVAPGNHLTWGDDGVHAILRGTSQAAPHVDRRHRAAVPGRSDADRRAPCARSCASPRTTTAPASRPSSASASSTCSPPPATSAAPAARPSARPPPRSASAVTWFRRATKRRWSPSPPAPTTACRSARATT